MNNEERIEQCNNLIHLAIVNRDKLVAEMCPGEHKLAQHRDRKSPWCNSCGRNRMGETIKEV